jgi:phosphate transport system permease protein
MAAVPAPPIVAASVLRSIVGKTRRGEAVVRGLFAFACILVVLSTLAILAYIVRTGARGIGEVGLGQLLFSKTWKPEAHRYGGLALIVGTAATGVGAALLAGGPAILTALCIHEFAHKSFKQSFRRLMEVAVAIPSVVFGWLALTKVVPLMDSLAHGLYGVQAPVTGEGIASSALLLSVMICPTVMLLSLDALSRVPQSLKDASLALGASPFQTAFRVVLPQVWRGLVLALFFGFARAAGETMAVQMVIGGARKLPVNLFSPTATISTQVVMDMQNSQPNTPANDVLYSMSLVLLVISTGVVLLTRALNREKRA